MGEMDSKERLAAALAGRPTDHLPFSPFLAYVWEHFPRHIQDAGQLAFHQLIGADPLWRGAPCPVRAIPSPQMRSQTVEANGRTTVRINTPVGALQWASMKSDAGSTSFLVEHPLKTREDYKTQMWIEERTTFEFAPKPVHEHLAGQGREGLSIGMLIPRAKSAYQSLVEHLVGTEELIYAQADFPDVVESLWRVMVEKDLEAVRLAQSAAYDYFLTWEDSGTQNYSPTQYDAYIGSEIGQWCAILSNAGKRYVQHACGHVKSLVGRMKAHGVAAVESVSSPPTGDISIREARRILGPDVGIVGGIEPTHFLGLSVAELSKYVETVIEEAQGGPFVLANSDSCPPGVDIEKFRVVAEIARSHKR